MRVMRAIAAFSAALFFSACGGSTTGGESDGTGGSGGGGSASGGSPGSGGGSTGGGSGAGPDDCALVDCRAIGCGPGSTGVTRPGECCPTCVPIDCGDVSCATVDCDPGYHMEFVPSECCPVCVAGPSDAELCEAGQSGLLPGLEARLGADAFACTTVDDCEIVYLRSRCGPDCGTGINAAFASDALAFVEDYGDDNCGTCPDDFGECPPYEPTVRCDAGRCDAQ